MNLFNLSLLLFRLPWNRFDNRFWTRLPRPWPTCTAFSFLSWRFLWWSPFITRQLSAFRSRRAPLSFSFSLFLFFFFFLLFFAFFNYFWFFYSSWRVYRVDICVVECMKRRIPFRNCNVFRIISISVMMSKFHSHRMMSLVACMLLTFRTFDINLWWCHFTIIRLPMVLGVGWIERLTVKEIEDWHNEHIEASKITDKHLLSIE